MCSLSSYKQRERRECGYSRRFYRLNVYTTNLYPPTGALDSNSAADLLNTVKESNKTLDTTILMVTHDAYAASFADRILIFKDGRIIRELFKQNDDRRTFYESIALEVAKLDTER